MPEILQALLRTITMKTTYAVALAMLAGVAIGGTSVGGLYAQNKTPGAYAIVAFSDTGDAAAFKTNVLDKAPDAVKKHGGHFIARTNEITVLRAAEPQLKRYVIIAFDDVQKAKSWYGSEDMKAINSYNDQHTKGRAFIVPAAQ
jgi:uncharacterized protein (DUF1330 family)